MRDIFTDPSNSATYYIDPNYVGDNTVGYKKRINELLAGTMFTWNGATPSVTTNNFMRTTSKYAFYYDEWFYPYTGNGGAISFKHFADKPALIAIAGWETAAADLNYYTLNDTDWDLEKPIRRYYVANHGLKDGDYITLPYHYEGLWHRTGYAKVWNANEFTLTVSDTLDDPWIYGDILGGNVGAFVTRESNGVRVWYNYIHGVSDGDPIKLSNNFTEAHDTGTANSETTQFYAAPGFSQYSHRVYTDSGLTINATLTENYHDQKTWSFTNTTGADLEFNLADMDVSGLPGIGGLQAENFMVCRLVATNLIGGTFSSKVDSARAIPYGGAIEYDYEFWFQYIAGAKVDIYDDRNKTNYADFMLTAGASVDITAYFVNPARMGTGGYYKNLEQFDLTGGEVWYRNNINITGIGDPIIPLYTIQSVNLQVPSNEVFQYQNTSNVTTFGARLGDWYVAPGENAYRSWPSGTPTMNFTPVGGGNNRLSSVSLDLNAPREVEGDITEAILSIYALPNEYVAPAPTPAEIAGWEDIHSASYSWDNTTGYEGSGKRWPDGREGVYPRRVQIKENTPTLVNFSQNGRKYVRSGGYTKWTLEVDYPPLTWDQFRYLQAAANLARGQAATFEFYIADVTDFSKYWPFAKTLSVNNFPIVRNWIDGRRVLVDGYPSNYVNVGKAGQLVNVGSDRNGETASVLVNDVQANIYGEAVLTVAYDNFNWQTSTGNQIWMEPTFLVVSLNSDDFDWSVDEAGLYRVNVSFVLDFSK